MINKAFDRLNPSELLLILKHLKLGRDHLKKVLTDREFSELIALGPIDKTNYKSPVKTTDFLLPLNGVLSGMLGGWLGLNSYLGLKADSLPIFFVILSVCLTIGFSISRYNVQRIKAAVQKRYEERKIEELQTLLIDRLHIFRKEEINEKLKEIEDNTGEPVDLNRLLKADNQQTIPCLKKLMNSRYTSTPQAPWLGANIGAVIVSFIPTIFGTFGSIFFYLPNVPNLVKKLGQYKAFEVMTTPEAKAIQLVVVLSITIYLCVDAIIQNRKAFLRDKEKHEMSQEIAKKENNLSILDDQLLKIKELTQPTLVH